MSVSTQAVWAISCEKKNYDKHNRKLLFGFHTKGSAGANMKNENEYNARLKHITSISYT